MDITKELNDSQIEAVNVKRGPLLILAGAGSGKTKTLTYRIAQLIRNENIKPENILAVTFTNKAAKEMRERLGTLLNQPALNHSFMPWMGTFHGICVKLLRTSGQYIGIDRNFIIYDEGDKLSLIKQAMKQVRLEDEKIKPNLIGNAISAAKNDFLTPDDLHSQAKFYQQKDIARVYEKYEKLKQAAGALDFDDLLIETVKLLQQNKVVRDQWQSHFKHILIDEYQDTNSAQYQIIKLLVNSDKNICAVGDDWQSIYSWRGADYTNILNFEQDFPGTSVVRLEQNYRSTGNILGAAANVIKKNTKRTDKALWTDAGAGAPVRLNEAADEAAEARQVARQIETATTVGGRNYNDFAVLYRTNAQSVAMERAFLQYHIPYKIVGGVRFYDRKEIRDLVAFLKVAYQPNDTVSFSRISNVPTRGIGATSLERFLFWQEGTGLNIIEALLRVEEANGLTPRAKAALRQLGVFLESLRRQAFEEGPAQLIETVIKKTDYLEYIKEGTPKDQDREESVKILISEAQQFADLGSFLEEVALMSSADSATDGRKVTMMTLHAAKGLEFPVVFIVGLEEGILPHVRTYDSGIDSLEEERRLMYVGMTRAREELILSYAVSRYQYGTKSYNMQSRFIAEIGDYLADSLKVGSPYGTGHSATNLQDEFFQDMEQDPFMDEVNLFEVGDMVSSSAFGIGEVVDVDGLAVSVKFKNGKVKKLNTTFASLKKI